MAGAARTQSLILLAEDDARSRLLQSSLDDLGLEFASDGQSIRWSASNRQHPRNWNMLRKIYDSSLIIWLDLFTTAVSTAGVSSPSEHLPPEGHGMGFAQALLCIQASASDSARNEFGISRTLSTFVFVSVYLVGQGFGSIIFPPFSEAFGRKKLYITSTALYGICCAIVGVIPSIAGIVVGRFFGGFLSAIPTTVVAGSIEDMFNTKDRVWMIFLWAGVSNIGLITGPIMGTYISAALGWRWVFNVAAIVVSVTMVLFFAIRESRPSLLLVREVAKLRKATGIEELHALNPDHMPSLQSFARIALFRPLQLFFTEPIVFLVSVMSGIAFALIYLFTAALPPVYEAIGFSSTEAPLPFLAVGVGLLLGLATRVLDSRIIDKHHKEGRPITPEHKLIGFAIGAPTLAGALWWFAWTIPPRVQNLHWLVSTTSLVFVGYAVNEFDTVLAGYLADSYLSYAASGFAAVALLRSTMSAAFPLFASQMFTGLSANVAVSILAALATVFCVVPWLFTQHGEKIRARSKFARYSFQVYQETGVDKRGL